MGKGGKVMRCHECDLTKHFLSKCPHTQTMQLGDGIETKAINNVIKPVDIGMRNISLFQMIFHY